MFKKVVIRFVSTVGAAAFGAVAAASVLDITAWKAALTAAFVTGITLARNILIAYKDGDFSEAEAEAVFRDAE